MVKRQDLRRSLEYTMLRSARQPDLSFYEAENCNLMTTNMYARANTQEAASSVEPQAGAADFVEWQVSAATKLLVSLIAPEIEGTNTDGSASAPFGEAMNLAARFIGVTFHLWRRLKADELECKSRTEVELLEDSKYICLFYITSNIIDDSCSGDAGGHPSLEDREAAVVEKKTSREELTCSSTALILFSCEGLNIARCASNLAWKALFA
ncbi:hypothetical protein TSMEX_008533 [Taenia solium]|eukprot:TsM_000186200 transcript=TsM_000186200 gene=TsM_000186200